jgi:hypothetical protein
VAQLRAPRVTKQHEDAILYLVHLNLTVSACCPSNTYEYGVWQTATDTSRLEGQKLSFCNSLPPSNEHEHEHRKKEGRAALQVCPLGSSSSATLLLLRMQTTTHSNSLTKF